jgi:hypothetical protein
MGFWPLAMVATHVCMLLLHCSTRQSSKLPQLLRLSCWRPEPACCAPAGHSNDDGCGVLVAQLHCTIGACRGSMSVTGCCAQHTDSRWTMCPASFLSLVAQALNKLIYSVIGCVWMSDVHCMSSNVMPHGTPCATIRGPQY